MTERILERRGDQIWVEYEDYWTGETMYEWRDSPMRMCPCGKRESGKCNTVRVTTFTETYKCGYVYRYTNHAGYEDNLIEVNGRRVKGK